MKWRFGMIIPLPVACGMVLIIVWIWSTPKPVQAFPQYFTAFNTRYGTAGLGRLNTCGVCHMEPSTLSTIPKPRNDYGLAFQKRSERTTDPDAALAAIEDDNSDHDTLGLTNLQEINNRFFPGYASDPRRLTVNIDGSGSGTVSRDSNSGAICGTSFCYPNHNPNPAPNDPDPDNVLESVTLMASPDSGSTFTSWRGCNSTTGPSCQVTLNQNKTVTATFTLEPQPQQFTLTVRKEGAGAGSGTVTSVPARINCGSTCMALFDSGTPVTLMASSASGSTFTGWSGEGVAALLHVK